MLRKVVSRVGLAVAAAFVVEAADAYTVESQYLRVGAHVWVEPVFGVFDEDQPVEEVSGPGNLAADVHAFASALGESVSVDAVGGSVLSPRAITISAQMEIGGPWTNSPLPPTAFAFYDLVFSVSAPTEYSFGPPDLPYLEGFDLYDLGNPLFHTLPLSGTLAPGRYRWVGWVQLDPYILSSSNSLQLVTVPEPGAATLVGLGCALIARSRRRAW